MAGNRTREIVWYAGAPPTEGRSPAVGWGVPMPLPVRSRRYDDAFWKDLFAGSTRRSKEQNLKELGF